MFNIPSTRLTVPRAAAGEIVRQNLINTILCSPAKLVYIHAGAGYGKTTLLSQVANSFENSVWLSLDSESDIFTFINSICAAIKQTFPKFDFSVSEYIPFSEKDNFISMLAGALGRYLKLCSDNGLYEYFRLRKAYDPVLEFAYENGIEPDFTKQMMEFAGYRPKKVYVETLGAFTVYLDRDKRKLLKFRTKKERELLAFLLDAGDQGATKEQLRNAIWRESDSKNIKNLIAVNMRHLKNDLECAGIEKSIICLENRYFICRDEISLDADLFERTYEEFKLNNTKEQAKKLLSLYKGEYLSDFEALWAIVKRVRYHENYEEAEKYLSIN